ncbi:MAG: hypothetical protein M1828_001309 [Chrysothrix sp. TS-e1954]|nr:MAG: hypothetical protein M1828_001309 [Chrysothrix sp. TS-e1954]
MRNEWPLPSLRPAQSRQHGYESVTGAELRARQLHGMMLNQFWSVDEVNGPARDLWIRSGNDEAHVHKVVIACQSARFRALIRTPSREGERHTGNITVDLGWDWLQALLGFLYHGDYVVDDAQQVVAGPNPGVVIYHARMYSIGTKFEVDALKAVARERYSYTLNDLVSQHDLTTFDFEGLVQRIYTSTSDGDRELREPLLATMRALLKETFEMSPAFEEALKSMLPFAADMSIMLAKDLQYRSKREDRPRRPPVEEYIPAQAVEDPRLHQPGSRESHEVPRPPERIHPTQADEAIQYPRRMVMHPPRDASSKTPPLVATLKYLPHDAPREPPRLSNQTPKPITLQSPTPPPKQSMFSRFRPPSPSAMKVSISRSLAARTSQQRQADRAEGPPPARERYMNRNATRHDSLRSPNPGSSQGPQVARSGSAGVGPPSAQVPRRSETMPPSSAAPPSRYRPIPDQPRRQATTPQSSSRSQTLRYRCLWCRGFPGNERHLEADEVKRHGIPTCVKCNIEMQQLE